MDGTRILTKEQTKQLTQLILDVRFGRKTLDNGEATSNLEYPAAIAVAIMRASRKANFRAPIVLAGTVNGNLEIWGSIDGDLTIEGSIDGNLEIWGSIDGDLTIEGSIDGNLDIWGSIDGDLTISDPGSIGGEVYISGSIGEGFSIWGSIDGELTISDPGSIGGEVYISGSIGEGFSIWGSIGEDLAIRDSGSIGGAVYISGSISGLLTIEGSFKGQANLLKTEIGSLSGASFERPVFLDRGVDLYNCEFRGFSGFEQLRFVGSTLFGHGSAKRISHTQGVERLDDTELAGIYRELRQVYERQSNRPEAGDFYFQEMNARRRACFNIRQAPQWFVLSAYWLISGYSQRAWRAIVWFFAVAAASSWLFLDSDLLITAVDIVDGESEEVWHSASTTQAFQFSVQSMVSFFSPPKGDLDEQGRWYQLALRFIGPTILAQAILAIREKVAR